MGIQNLRGRNNALKTRGIGAIRQALQHEQQVGLRLRGQLRDVVMDRAEFHRLRKRELDLALQRCRAIPRLSAGPLR